MSLSLQTIRRYVCVCQQILISYETPQDFSRGENGFSLAERKAGRENVVLHVLTVQERRKGVLDEIVGPT